MNSVYISLILILIIAVVIIIKSIRISPNNKEHFISKQIIITDNLLNVKDASEKTLAEIAANAANAANAGDAGEEYMFVDSRNLATIIDDVKRTNIIDKNTIKDIKGFEGIEDTDANIQLLIDPYINYYVLNNKAANSTYKEGIFVCVSNKVLRKEDCVWDIEGKVIAYMSMSDYLFIQAFIKGYNLNSKNIYLKKITERDFENTEKIFDYLFTYVVLNSEYMNFIFFQRYYINGFKDVDIHRIKAYYPFIKENYNTIKYYYTKDGDTKNNDLYLSTETSLLPIMRYDIVSAVENFVSRLEMPVDYLEAVKEDYDKSDKGGFYGCYGNGEITNKFECDSYYNIDGTPKNYYSFWDKKCETDEECPYFKSNTNYPNNRGGCIKGNYCEFPVGVKRLGFTKYTDVNLNTPLCHNCKYDENGKKPEKPDYVFENDFDEREKNNLNTIISLLDYRDL
jgi:hypothetical protein